MSVSAIREITLGVGHLRRQVSFYGSAFGLRVTAKGRVPAAVAEALWRHDDLVDAVVMARLDLPHGTRLRLLRTSGLPARPDFDVSVPGPLGVVWGAGSSRRTYYRLSGAGVEFHAAPATDAEGDDTDTTLYGRTVDGEYAVIAPRSGPDHDPRRRGTPSRHFGVTEPIAVSLVTVDPAADASFLERVFGWTRLDAARRDDPAALRAMGLGPELAHEVEWFGVSGDSGALLELVHFGRSGATTVQPPARGIAALRVDCEALDAVLEAARDAGAQLVGDPFEVDDVALGRGRVATLQPSFGLMIELWEPAPR
ncbi:MAG: VOC family protein [Acidobacteriota bacterium]